MVKKPNCKVRILKPLEEVYRNYQPTVGEVYDAFYQSAKREQGKWRTAPVCVITIKDKFICLRKGEFEILGEA